MAAYRICDGQEQERSAEREGGRWRLRASVRAAEVGDRTPPKERFPCKSPKEMSSPRCSCLLQWGLHRKNAPLD